MKRDIYQKLIEWKTSKRRKPLLLKGARQTGKTYILKEFGRNEYQNAHYFNFEEDLRLKYFFENNLKPERIIEDLSVYSKRKIESKQDLIIFDEIQSANNALSSLKYFQEQANDFHIVAAGSLLGVKLSSPGSFPVGKVNFINIHPLTFLEFLDAMGKTEYRQMLENINTLVPLAVPFHEELIDLLRKYYFIGGMPEAVNQYVETNDILEVREIHNEIINSYVLDFAKHAPVSDIPKLSLIWNSIPSNLAKENKKFIFSALKKGARAREYENALIWLEDAGLILRASAVETSKIPLRAYADKSCFKVYCLDVGILGTMSRIEGKAMLYGNSLFSGYGGSFVENYAAQQLISAIDGDLYYWRSKGEKAELDFLCEYNGHIYPLEVKAGINPKSKSLKSYDEQFAPQFLVRTTLLNLRQNGKIYNIPLYMMPILGKILKLNDN